MKTENLTPVKSKVCPGKFRGRTLLLMIGLACFAILVWASSLGVFECNYCNPEDPFDELTLAFIRSQVNQEVTEWHVGDHVPIVNPTTNQAAVWGRASQTTKHSYMGSPGVWGYSNVGGNWFYGGGGLNPCDTFVVCPPDFQH